MFCTATAFPLPALFPKHKSNLPLPAKLLPRLLASPPQSKPLRRHQLEASGKDRRQPSSAHFLRPLAHALRNAGDRPTSQSSEPPLEDRSTHCSSATCDSRSIACFLSRFAKLEFRCFYWVTPSSVAARGQAHSVPSKSFTFTSLRLIFLKGAYLGSILCRQRSWNHELAETPGGRFSRICKVIAYLNCTLPIRDLVVLILKLPSSLVNPATQ